MITIKSLRILDLGLPDWHIVTEKYKILTLVWKGKACDLSHSLDREGVRQGVRERSHAITGKAWLNDNSNTFQFDGRKNVRDPTIYYSSK